MDVMMNVKTPAKARISEETSAGNVKQAVKHIK
jgi:hypothetical protein